MERHIEFTEWAVAQGVKLNGIAAHKFPGRGLGVIAEKRIVAGTNILKVPYAALRTHYTVPKIISKGIGPITIHGLLAATLILDKTSYSTSWQAVMPTFQDFSESMPLMWPPTLQALLPTVSRTLLLNQKRKLSKDWSAVVKAYPEISYDDYLYNWLLVNTRTFHFISTSRKVNTPSNPDDRMALNPFADLFNHTDADGCGVAFGPEGYTIIANQDIESGEEIYISYGSHSNDFLLTEYGFILPENRWDEISLDPYILPLLSENQKEGLDDVGFLGKYVLDNNTVCYRTQVALRAIFLPMKQLQRFLNGQDDGERDQSTVNQFLIKVLDSHLKDAEKKLKRLRKVDCGLASQRETLSRRWHQIRLLLITTKSRM